MSTNKGGVPSPNLSFERVRGHRGGGQSESGGVPCHASEGTNELDGRTVDTARIMLSKQQPWKEARKSPINAGLPRRADGHAMDLLPLALLTDLKPGGG